MQLCQTIAALALGALSITSIAGQSGPAPDGQAWATLAVPQGVVGNALEGQGKLVLYRDGTTVHVFSSATRCWHETTASATATIRLFNDCLVILDSSHCRALASHTGSFVDVPLAAPASAALLNAGAHKNDSIILLADGSQVHAFSGFTGTWTTRTVGPNYAAAVQRHVALLSDGNTVAALGAFEGTWRDQLIPGPISTLSADGTVGIATSGARVYAFSANTDTWHEQQVPAGTTFERGDDWGLWHGGGRAIAFSGLRAQFSAVTADVSGSWGATNLYALLRTPVGLIAYSAVTASFSAPQRDPVQVEVGAAAAVLHDNRSVRGYSPLRQRFVALHGDVGASDVGNHIAYVTEAGSGVPHVWSSSTANWYTAPLGTQTSLPILTTTTVGLTTPTETYAFAADSGTFVPLGGTILGFASNPTSAPLLAYDSGSFFAFDTRTESWLPAPRTSTAAPLFRVWRTTSLVLDGTVALGIGAQAGRWHEYDLQALTSSVFANSEVGYAATGNLIAACGMVPTVTPLAQFPHFRRVQAFGAPLRHTITIPDQAVAVAAFGLLTAANPIPNLGTLWLDPVHTEPVIALPTASPAAFALRWDLPADPQLLGVSIGSQALVLPATAPPYLSELGTSTIW